MFLSDCIQLLQDGVFILLSEASCQQLIYLPLVFHSLLGLVQDPLHFLDGHHLVHFIQTLISKLQPFDHLHLYLGELNTLDHRLQAGDLVFRLVQELLPVSLLLEQQLGPVPPAVPQELPGQLPLPLQLLRDPLLVLLQLIPLLLQLLQRARLTLTPGRHRS